MIASFNDDSVVCIRKLRAKNLTHGVAHLKHSANPGADRSGQCQRFENVAVTDNDLSIAVSQSTLFDSADCRDLLQARSENRAWTFSVPIHVAGKTRDRFVKNGCVQSSDQLWYQAILTVSNLHPPQHHFRMSNKVLVHLNQSVCRLDSAKFGPGLARRRHFQ